MIIVFQELWVVVCICSWLYFSCLAFDTWFSKCIQNVGVSNQQIPDMLNENWLVLHFRLLFRLLLQ